MSGFSLNSAERCLAIVELLVDHPEGLPLTLISNSLELPASATHRLLTVLGTKGYVKQNPLSNHYAPTMAIAALGLRLLASYHVPDICQPVLEELAEQSGELVRLSFLEEGRLIWIAKAQGSKSSLRYDPIIGRDVPLHVTAMGKAFLASMTDAEATALVAKIGYEGDLIGPCALRTEAELLRELAMARTSGYGLVEEEAEAGVSAIAMVVHDGMHAGALTVAALSIAGPSFRVTHERLRGFVPFLKEATANLTRLWAVHRYQSAQVTAKQRAA